MPGVGFDIDHTLVIDNKLERVAFMRLLEIVEARGGRVLGTLDEETGRIDDLLRAQRAGAFSIAEAVGRFVTQRGLEPSEEYVNAFRAFAMRMVDDFVIPVPGVHRVLHGLRERGIPVAVLSNGWNPLQVLKAQRVGFEGPVVASADIGTQKPSPLAFTALLSALGTPAEQTWYVGDDPVSDIGGARGAEIHAVWFDWENKVYPSDLAPPSHTIHCLEELLQCVPSL